MKFGFGEILIQISSPRFVKISTIIRKNLAQSKNSMTSLHVTCLQFHNLGFYTRLLEEKNHNAGPL